MSETVLPGMRPLYERHISIGFPLYVDVNGARRQVTGVFVDAEERPWAGEIYPDGTLFRVEPFLDPGIGQSVPAPPRWKEHMQCEIRISLGYQAQSAPAAPDASPPPNATCSCGVDLLWRTHPRTRKAAPLEATPAPDGNIILDADGVHYTIIPKAARATYEGPRYRNHFAGCPHAPRYESPH